MKKLNRVLIFFLLVCLVQLPCLSESYSDGEIVVPIKQWQKLKMNLEALKQNSMKLEELNLKESELTMKEKELQQKEQELNLKEKELTEQMQTSLQNVNQSLQKSKSEILQDKITVGIVSFSAGAIIGAGAFAWVASKLY